MKKRSFLNRAVPIAVALLLGTAAQVTAHDTWLLPASLRVAVGTPVRLSLTSGMLFPADDFAIAATRVVRADVRLGATTTRLTSPTAGKQALRYSFTPARPGIATIAVALAPRTLSLTPDLVKEYFAEIGAGAELRRVWDSMPAPKKWRESYVKHAKSFVRVGDARDSSWREPSGLGLELVPQADPTALAVGDTLDVLVIKGGLPLAAFPIGSVYAGTAAPHFDVTDPTGTPRFSVTDSHGRARVPLKHEGLLLLNGTQLRRSTKAGLEWESDFTTLTLAIGPRRTSR